MKKLTTFLCYILFSMAITAQNNESTTVGSLEKLAYTRPDSVIAIITDLEEELNQEEKLAYQLVKTKAYILSGKLKEATEVVDGILGMNPNDSVLLQANYLKGALLFYTNEREKGLALYKKVYRTALDKKDTNMIAKVAANLSAFYIKKDAYDSALVYLETSYKIDKANNDSIYIASDHVYFGVCYNAMELYDQAIAEYRKALLYNPDPTTTANAFYNMAVSFSKKNLPDSTIFYGKKAEMLYEQFNNTSGTIRLYTVMGTAYLAKRAFKKAIEFHTASMQLAEQTGDERAVSIAQNNLSICYFHLNDGQKAIRFAKAAYETNIKLETIDFAANAAENLAIGYAMSNQGDSAQKYIGISDSLRQTVIKNNYVEKLSEFQSQLQLAEKEAMLAKNQLEIQQQKLDLQSYRSNLYLSIFILVVLLILGVGLFVYIKNRQKQQMQQLLIQEKELSLKREIEATEKEKSRLSKELHDGIGQELTALKMNLGVIISDLNDPGLKDQLNTINKQLSHSALGVRTISHQMMPRALEENGLKAAVDDLLEVSFSNSNINYEYNTGNLQNRLPKKLEIALFRIIQEAVSNILKYSQASKVFVQLYEVDDYLVLNIEDNGVGFSQATQKGHGLHNMKSRIQAFDGVLQINSSPGEGTNITARVKSDRYKIKQTA